MSGGLVALLDDIATLAKVTASSIDDVAANAVKASSKAVGVVIDDTAVTPQYVSGLSPERELPIIAKIARGSLINKLFIILPIALLLTWLAPQVLPFLLVVGVFHHILETAEHAVSAAGGFVTWLVETVLSGVFGVILGAVVAWIVVGASALARRVRAKA